MRAILPPWTLYALSDFRDELLARLSLCSSLTSLDIASPMRLHTPFCMLCSVAVFSIYNAFPEHSKQENWEKRCLCVSWLCGCAQDVKQDVDGRYSCATSSELLMLTPHRKEQLLFSVMQSSTAQQCMAVCTAIVPVTQGSALPCGIA